MSAAATAAGYLYASGRLRGRAQREQEHHDDQPAAEHAERRPAQAARPRIERPRKEVRVAALPEVGQQQQERPRRTPTIQYCTRRWRPSEE
ncbi:MAG: hypothetical protein E6H57_12130 [Betaproteobacteria bacterium]|nr:MAG: hypothetical protein E6H57_12130 [Betaproteobacteria bacterium]